MHENRIKAEHETATTAIAKGHHTSLPKGVRKALGAGSGDRPQTVIEDDTVWLTAVKPVGRSYDMHEQNGRVLPIEDMDHGIVEGAARK